MKKRYLFLILIPLTAWFLLRGHPGVSLQKLDKNLEYGVLKPEGENASLHFIRFSLRDYQLKPILASDYGQVGLSSQEMAKRSQALAVINANFFDEKHKALGLVIDQKKIKNPLHPTSWWASFLSRGEKAEIVLSSPAKTFTQYDFGVQAGPRLVIAGKVPTLKSHVSAKSAIGIDRKGHIVIVATQGVLDIQNFARHLAKSEKAGGLGLRDALNLDGGSSTQFYIQSGDFTLHIPSFIKVPVGIGVFLRK